MSELRSLPTLLTTLAQVERVGVDQSHVVSGRDFQCRVGAWHRLMNLPPGQQIALYHRNSIEFAAALYAAWLHQLTVIVPGDTLPSTRVELAPLVAAFVGEFGIDTQIQTPTAPGESIDLPLPLGLDSQIQLLTSGSSGKPVRVVKCLAQLEAEVQTLEQVFGPMLLGCRIVATVSHQHIYGMLFRLLWPLASARAFEAHTHSYLESVAEAANQEALALVASPAHLKRLPTGLDWSAQQHSLRVIFSSGGPLDLASAQAVSAATGHAPIEVYGSTETGGIGWRQQTAPDIAFRPLPGIELEQGEARTLLLRSPHLPDNNWLQLSDLGDWSEDAGLRLCGRADRIAKIEEKRVSLTAIEEAAMRTLWLSHARIVALDGQRIQLGLVGVPTEAGRALLLSSGRRRLATQLRADLAQSCERIALPRRFRFVGELPHNMQGKTTDALLQALFAETESRPQLPFFDWRSREASSATAQLWISPDLYHFQGHFPGQPIIPGVTQIEWAIVLARRLFALPARLLRMENLKFQALIQPGICVELELHWTAARQQLEFKLRSAAGSHATARLVFADE